MVVGVEVVGGGGSCGGKRRNREGRERRFRGENYNKNAKFSLDLALAFPNANALTTWRFQIWFQRDTA